MRRLPLLIVSGSFAAASFVACRGSGDDTVTPDMAIGGQKIQDVQNDTMAPGTPVTLNGVVVTAVDKFGGKMGDLWVEEPEGGPFSGIHVFTKGMDTGVAVGDIVNISGAQKSEFALSGSGGDMTGRTVTELEPVTGGAITVTKTGTGSVPAPAVVDALAIGQMYDASMQAAGGGAAFNNQWEQWEGVLITLTNVAAASAPKSFGSTMPTPADNWAFNITGVAKVEGTLTDITMSNIQRATCFGTMTGVVDYFFDYLVLPRSSADFATGGTGCPAAEAAAGTAIGTCGDGIDNDANGFKDCADLGCAVGANAWLGASCAGADATCGCSKNYNTGAGAQGMNTDYATTSGPVMSRDLYVTAINTTSATGTKGYWVSDSLTQAAGHSVFVFTGSNVDASITIGKKLPTLQGLAGPFPTSGSVQKLVELSNPTNGAATTGGAIVPLTGVATDTLSNLANGGAYAGVVVSLPLLKVKSVGMHNQVVLVDNSNKTITMDDDAFFNYSGTATAAVPAVGTCYTTVVGVMNLQTTDQVRTINPRSATDMVTGSGCTGN